MGKKTRKEKGIRRLKRGYQQRDQVNLKSGLKSLREVENAMMR